MEPDDINPGLSGYVFVSYSRADQSYVDDLGRYLERHGVVVWTDQGIDYGARWPVEIRQAVDNCAAFVVVMTPAAEESEWVGLETQRAKTRGRPILPLLLQGEPFFVLGSYQYEDVSPLRMPSPGFVDHLLRLATDADSEDRPVIQPIEPETHAQSFGLPDGLFSWTDLASPDPEAATEFYSALFGWEGEVQTDPDGNYIYTMLTKDGKNVAGLGPQPEMMTGLPPMWNSYINVTSVDDTIAAAMAAGGSVIVPAMDVMDLGRMAFLADPSGAAFGLWQAGTHRGADIFTEPGSMSWNELATRDLEGARKFYSSIVPWEFEMHSPADDATPPEYWVIKMPTKVDGDGDADDEFNGGVIGMDENWPAEVPAHWMVYFLVDDTEATAAKAAELGGNISVPPFDTSAGKIAVLNDPQGGTFSIISAPSGQ